MADEERLAKLEIIVNTISSDISDIKTALKDIASALKTLAVLEEKHNSVVETVRRAFKNIDHNTEGIAAIKASIPDNLKKKIEDIDRAMPNLILASSWVFKAMLFVMATLGLAALAQIVKTSFGQ